MINILQFAIWPVMEDSVVSGALFYMLLLHWVELHVSNLTCIHPSFRARSLRYNMPHDSRTLHHSPEGSPWSYGYYHRLKQCCHTVKNCHTTIIFMHTAREHSCHQRTINKLLQCHAKKLISPPGNAA